MAARKHTYLTLEQRYTYVRDCARAILNDLGFMEWLDWFYYGACERVIYGNRTALTHESLDGMENRLRMISEKLKYTEEA